MEMIMLFNMMRAQSVVQATFIAVTLISAFNVQAQPIGYAPGFVSPFLYTGSGNFSGGWGLQGIKGVDQQGSFVITETSHVNGVLSAGQSIMASQVLGVAQGLGMS
jgi:hypothetical protein